MDFDTTHRQHDARIFQPRFSGKPEENVNQYIQACRLIPLYHGYTENYIDELRALALYQGTSKEARSFLDTLPEAVLNDFAQASTQLKGKFPWNPQAQQAIVLEKITTLNKRKCHSANTFKRARGSRSRLSQASLSRFASGGFSD
ncbi:unnamed protein product [Penicillium manginii]